MYSNEVISAILAMEPVVDRLCQEFFNTSVVRLRAGLEGQTVSEDGIIFIGDRAGPGSFVGAIDISNICHEMAHLVEIDDARMRSQGWGLTVPEIFVIDRICQEPTTKDITMRELRVAAYQSHLLAYLGVSKPVGEIVDSFDWLPDSCYVPIEDGRKPYGANYEAVRAEGIDIQKSQHRWRINQVKKLKKIFTLDRFLSEWKRKVQWLQDNPFTTSSDMV